MLNSGDFQVCVTEANAFLLVAKKCEENWVQMVCGGMYPFAVNATFSCELYIKAIMIHNSAEKKAEWGHDLKELFEKLPLSDQTEVRKGFKQKSSENLDELLTKSGSAFEEWRYAFERGVTISITGILAFADTLKEYVEKLSAPV